MVRWLYKLFMKKLIKVNEKIIKTWKNKVETQQIVKNNIVFNILSPGLLSKKSNNL